MFLFRRLFLILLTSPWAGPAASAQEAGASGGKESVFAFSDLTGQAVALAVDDTGRVYLSVTGRSFGRGVYDAGASDALRRDDAGVRSLADRRELTARWITDGLVKASPPGSGESVICLTDTDGDGRADQKSVIAGEFNDALDGPAGGLLPLGGGSVLFGCTPALWRLEDDNGDWRADRRLPLFQGLGIQSGRGTAGCRAITEGPDGRVYFTVADRGVQTVSLEGRRFSLEGDGAVFRCWPDGADLELIATGLCDPAGIVVDDRGRIFVVDTSPDATAARMLYVLPGSDFGWNSRMPERAVFVSGSRPSWMLPEAGLLNVRATGMTIRPQLLNGSRLPELIVADGRADGGLVPVSLEEKGGGFAAASQASMWRGGAACGVTAAPDGTFMWVDWGPGIAATATPRVCRLPQAVPQSTWQSGALLLSEGFASRSVAELTTLLEHGHPLVRKRAAQALVRLGFQEALEPLSRTARRSPSLQARLNAVWGMAALARHHGFLLNEIILLFTSTEPEIRALALRIAGENGCATLPPEILQLLRDPSAEVRVEAAVAVARLQIPGAAGALAAALEPVTDPWERHALTWALSQTDSPAALSARGMRAESPVLKMAVLHALRLLRSSAVADFLETTPPPVAVAAGEAVYDELILPGYPALVALLDRSADDAAFLQPALVQRALAAALHLGTPAAAAHVAAFAELPGDKVPSALREAAVRTLAQWDTPPDRDPVYGRFDDALPRPSGVARSFLAKLQPSSVPAVSPEALLGIVSSKETPDPMRVDALQRLALIQPAKAMEAAKSFLPGNGTAVLRAAARGVIMKLEPGASYAQISETLAAGSPQELQTVLQVASRFDSRQAEALWHDLGKRFVEGTIDPAARLEVYEGLVMRDTATRSRVRRILEAADASLNEELDPLARWRMCETGGDPDKGRLLFETGRVLCCIDCHSVRGRGGLAGPELDGAGSRLSRARLLAALVQPSGEITQGHGQVTVSLHDGSSATGILHRRDDTSLLLTLPRGCLRLNADAVKSISNPVSPMPSAAALLSAREIRDLVAWLETLK